MAGDPLRITHLIRAKPPGEIGGADAHLLDLASAQAMDGHDVRVIFLGPAQLSGAVRDRGISVVNIASMSMAAWVRGTREAIRAQAPDVVHSHGYRADILAALLRPLTPSSARWTLVMTVHGFLRTSWGLRLLSWLNERALRSADVVIVVSSIESQRLTAMLRRIVTFIPNGVARAELLPRAQACRRLGTNPARRTVAFVGRLSPEKRPDLFIAMAALVARDRPEADFLVIGSGAQQRETVQQAAAMPDLPVTFTGLVSEVASLMEGIDVLVCPSDTEGTPRVVLEAMSAGVPVVATRVGGLPDLIVDGETGFLVPPNSAAALAGPVTRLLSDEPLYRCISHGARTHAEREFSGAAMATRVTATYRCAPPCDDSVLPPRRRAIQLRGRRDR
jgi:glycosyltransferase involved in cell wall biosynthesis